MLDADIFQPLVLGLLAISLILSLASFAMLGRLRKALESQEPRSARGEAREAAPEPAETSGWASPAAESEPAATGWGEPTPAASEPQRAGAWGEPAPAAAEPRPTGGWGEPAPAATAQPTPAAEPQPTGWGEPAPAAEPQPAPEEEPQEQPFERDGRWWFRRGDELLVYDEQAQQWVPAPQTQPAGGATAPGTQAGGTGVQPTPAAAAEPEGGHWKCPTCGAINGTTATTCRMCFTPRA